MRLATNASKGFSANRMPSHEPTVLQKSKKPAQQLAVVLRRCVTISYIRYDSLEYTQTRIGVLATEKVLAELQPDIKRLTNVINIINTWVQAGAKERLTNRKTLISRAEPRPALRGALRSMWLGQGWNWYTACVGKRCGILGIHVALWKAPRIWK